MDMSASTSATPYTDVTHSNKPPINENYVRRPLNAFIIWSQKERQKMAVNDPLMHHAEISKQLGVRWRQLPEDERQKYLDESKHLKQLHQSQFPHYKFQPRRQNTRNVKRPHTKKSLSKLECAILNESFQPSETIWISPSRHEPVTQPSPPSLLDLATQPTPTPRTIILTKAAKPNVNYINFPRNLESVARPPRVFMVPRFQLPVGYSFQNMIRFAPGNTPATDSNNFNSFTNSLRTILPKFPIVTTTTMNGLRIIAPVENQHSGNEQITISPVINKTVVNERGTSTLANSNKVVIDLTTTSPNDLFVAERSAKLPVENKTLVIAPNLNQKTNERHTFVNEHTFMTADESDMFGVDLRIKSPSAMNMLKNEPKIVAPDLEKYSVSFYELNRPTISSGVENDTFRNKLGTVLLNNAKNNTLESEKIIDDDSVDMDMEGENDNFVTLDDERKREQKEERQMFVVQDGHVDECMERNYPLINAPEFIDLDCVLDDLILSEYCHLRRSGLSLDFDSFLVTHKDDYDSHTQVMSKLKKEFPDYLMEEVKHLL